MNTTEDKRLASVNRYDLISRLASFATDEADTQELQDDFYRNRYEMLEDKSDAELEEFALGIWG